MIIDIIFNLSIHAKKTEKLLTHENKRRTIVHGSFSKPKPSEEYMKKTLLLASALVAASLCTLQPSAAKADDYGFVNVHNGFSAYDDGEDYRISWAYFTPANGGGSRNVLEGVIHPGQTRTLRLGRGGFSCVNDITFRLHNGLEYSFYNVDICGTHNFSVP